MELSRKAKDVVRRAARPHSLVFAIVWLVTTITLIVMLSSGVRRTGQYEIEPLLLRRRPAIGRWIPVLGVALALALVALDQGGALIVILLLPIAVVWTLVARRREIGLRPVLLALALTALAFLGGFPFWNHDFIRKHVFIFLLACTPITFVAGDLLHKRTGLGGSPLYAGQYKKALVSFLWGCLIFLPLGFLNAAGDSPATYPLPVGTFPGRPRGAAGFPGAEAGSFDGNRDLCARCTDQE